MRSLLLAAVLTLVAADVAAVPLRVRAHAMLEANGVRTGSGLALRGVLRDDAGVAIPGVAVQADLLGMELKVARTGPDGAFELMVAAEDLGVLARAHGDRLPWRLSYAGGANFGPAVAAGQLDLEREPTTIRMEIDSAEISVTDGPAVIRITVRGTQGPIPEAPVRLQVAGGPDLVGDADESGRVIFLVRPESLARVGRFDIRARYAGDRLRGPCQGRGTITISRPTRITLRVSREGDVRTGRYRFSGRLSDDSGALVGKMVAIVVRGAGEADSGPDDFRSQEATITDARGVFLVGIPARAFLDYEGAAVEARAMFQPAEFSLRPAMSPAALIPVPAPPGVPLSWYLTCLAVTTGLALLVIAIRLKFWLEIARWWAERWVHRRPMATSEGLGTVLVNTARGTRGRRDWITGAVVEADDVGVAVPGASITATPQTAGTATHELIGDESGTFSVGPLPSGAWQVRVARPDFLPSTFDVKVPHDGRFDGASFCLVSVRGRIRDVFVRAAGGLFSGFRWGFDTPRDARREIRVADSRVHAAVGELTELVEGAWFGPDVGTLDDVTRAESLGGIVEADP